MTRIFRLASFLSLAPLVCGCRATVAPPAVVPVHTPEPPPAALSGNPAGVRFHDDAGHTLWMRANYDVEGKKVGVALIRDTPEPGSTRRDDSYPVRYWPTCVAALDDLRLLVAGKSPSTGNTILELWSFSQPEFVPAPDAKSPAMITGGVRTRVDDVYDASEAGRELVDEIVPIGDPPRSRVLVRFHDSADVCVFDLESRGMVLLASPDAKPGAFAIPLLARAREGSAGRLATGERVYQFRVPGKTDDEKAKREEPRIVMLWDRDGDGEIESFEELTVAEYARRGYSVPNAWAH